jgi:hypothetical protein
MRPGRRHRDLGASSSPMARRAGSYCRVSTERQEREGHSYEEQQRLLRERAAEAALLSPCTSQRNVKVTQSARSVTTCASETRCCPPISSEASDRGWSTSCLLADSREARHTARRPEHTPCPSPLGRRRGTRVLERLYRAPAPGLSRQVSAVCHRMRLFTAVSGRAPLVHGAVREASLGRRHRQRRRKVHRWAWR